MTSVWNGRMYRPIVEDGKPYAILWDGQIWDIDSWGIPRGSDNLHKALDFIRFATATGPLAEQTKYISYGPARTSSMALVAEETKPHLPTAPTTSPAPCRPTPNGGPRTTSRSPRDSRSGWRAADAASQARPAESRHGTGPRFLRRAHVLNSHFDLAMVPAPGASCGPFGCNSIARSLPKSVCGETCGLRAVPSGSASWARAASPICTPSSTWPTRWRGSWRSATWTRRARPPGRRPGASRASRYVATSTPCSPARTWTSSRSCSPTTCTWTRR